MTPESWAQVSSLFDSLRRDPDHENRQRRISDLTLDSEAQSLLKAMLRSHDEAGGLLDRSTDLLNMALLGVEELPPSHFPDTVIGRQFGSWKIISELGSGGMGRVFEAERIEGPYRKVAALKLIRSGQYSEHTRQRFLDEMRTLAKLEHPNIARLIDGGISDDGIPWFVMEKVDGMSIVDYADQNHLTISDRASLIMQACDAVTHAHKNLIVHGDIKPSNILVNDDGQVRLVDFGIARTTSGQKERVFLPRFTPQYASPEQAMGENLTTASDVFGLCAVLYELCSGSPPRCQQETTTSADYQQYLGRPVEPMAQRFSQSRQRDALAKLRTTNPRAMQRQLDRDLKWILQRGLAVDSDGRMGTSAELQSELRRWQSGDAVQSHPPSRRYRFGRWASRHRLSFLAGTGAVAALAIGTAVAVNQARMASMEADKAQWVNQFLLEIFDGADPILNQRTPVSADTLTQQAVDRLLNTPEQVPPDVILSATSALADIQRKLGQHESAQKLLLRRLELQRERGVNDTELAQTYVDLGENAMSLEQFQPAREYLSRAHELAPLSDGVSRTSVRSASLLSNLLARTNELEQSDVLLAKLLESERAVQQLPDASLLLAEIYINRSYLFRTRHEFDVAETAAEKAVEAAQRIEHSRPDMLASALGQIAELHYDRGDAIRASDYDRQVLELYLKHFGPDHHDTLDAQFRLATSLSVQGEMREALDTYERFLARTRNSPWSDSQDAAAALTNMGSAARALGEFRHARDYYLEAGQLWQQLETRLPVSEAQNQIGLAIALMHLGNFPQSEQNFAEGLAILEQTIGDKHPTFQRIRIYHSGLMTRMGRLDEAERILQAAYPIVIESYGESHRRSAIAAVYWSELLAAQSDWQRAAEMAMRAVTILEQAEYQKRYAIDLQKAHNVLATAQSHFSK